MRNVGYAGHVLGLAAFLLVLVSNRGPDEPCHDYRGRASLSTTGEKVAR